jgi:hypothetical protein
MHTLRATILDTIHTLHSIQNHTYTTSPNIHTHTYTHSTVGLGVLEQALLDVYCDGGECLVDVGAVGVSESVTDCMCVCERECVCLHIPILHYPSK